MQAGTSHNLGTNFATAFGTQFENEKGELVAVHQTSWGMSTRMVGGVIMSHGDDAGLRLPPALAPVQATPLLWLLYRQRPCLGSCTGNALALASLGPAGPSLRPALRTHALAPTHARARARIHAHTCAYADMRAHTYAQMPVQHSHARTWTCRRIHKFIFARRTHAFFTVERAARFLEDRQNQGKCLLFRRIL
jgi:hypothetical protein